jgi:glycosyltransferase involved in cell wall biosynthesis
MRSALETMCPDGLFLGSLPHDDVAAAMASADLFFFPSATDTFGNVVLEAQAAGLPVIVSDRGGPSQHMVAGETGFICRADDADSFAKALTLLLTQRTRRTDMGRRAREYAEGRDWPTALTPLINAWLTAAQRKERVSDRPSVTGRRRVALGTPWP